MSILRLISCHARLGRIKITYCCETTEIFGQEVDLRSSGLKTRMTFTITYKHEKDKMNHKVRRFGFKVRWVYDWRRSMWGLRRLVLVVLQVSHSWLTSEIAACTIRPWTAPTIHLLHPFVRYILTLTIPFSKAPVAFWNLCWVAWLWIDTWTFWVYWTSLSIFFIIIIL